MPNSLTARSCRQVVEACSPAESSRGGSSHSTRGTTQWPNFLIAVAELSKPVPPRGDGTDTSCRSLFHQEVMGPTRLSKPIPPRSDGTDTSCRSLFHQEVRSDAAALFLFPPALLLRCRSMKKKKTSSNYRHLYETGRIKVVRKATHR